LARRCEYVVEGYGVDEWGAKDQGFNGKELMKSLQGIQKIPICTGCRKGGGKADCEMRACASSKKLTDCTECKTFMKCGNSEPLRKVRTGALEVGMQAETGEEKADNQQLIERWTVEIKTKCPQCGS